MAETAGARTLISLFRRTAQEMVADLVERLHAAGYPEVSGTQHPLYENIDPEGTRLTVLAARAGMTHQSMSELVQGLEARGYVERRPDPTDKRARLIRLTPAGRRLVTRALREIDRIEREWRSHWGLAGFEGDMGAVLERALAARSVRASEAPARSHAGVPEHREPASPARR